MSRVNGLIFRSRSDGWEAAFGRGIADPPHLQSRKILPVLPCLLPWRWELETSRDTEKTSVVLFLPYRGRPSHMPQVDSAYRRKWVRAHVFFVALGIHAAGYSLPCSSMLQ